jgi:ATP-dependent helicase HrpA
MSHDSNDTVRQLTDMRHSLHQAMIKDRYRLNRRIQNILSTLKQGSKEQVSPQRLKNLFMDFQQSSELYQKRKSGLPRPELNNQLPVIEFKDKIIETIENNQVVVLAGETGSGKTTQLPQICLEMGRGIGGFIGHTQPRRIAARSVAQRIAEELKTELGNYVGYKVRFTGNVRAESYIKLMTDGILLAEMQGDHFLNQYDTLIIDEAHERNLNIDFLLGYLKTLLPKRRDLKIIITSATIDTERFSRHFDDAPIIEVSGRTYPVEVRYRPLGETEELSDQGNKIQNAILAAVHELDKGGRGDVLVFLSGERDIRDLNNFLKKQLDHRNNDILPLFARLSSKDQNRVFKTGHKRRIILSTNVAETSLTVPGIKYVIDTGKARINRYNYKTKGQRLPIENISQSNADQRKGRCGRVSEGVCIRLYSQEDFESRPVFADPEIKRVNLASVILRMKVLKLGHIEEFPFLDPPDNRYIKDGYKLLNELSALDHHHKLTRVGRQLARMPIDPKVARMLIEASDQNALQELLIIASALSIQDPRERPHESTEAADKKHELFQDEQSDFLFYINLWKAFHEQARHLSNNQLRKWCRTHYLSYQRMREWLDVRSQLEDIARDIGAKLNQHAADYTQIHCSLSSGLLGNIGLRQEKLDYTGAREIAFSLFPGSSLTKKPPKWIIAAELLETQKLYALNAAKILPEWLEDLASHITKHHYSEPHWDEKSGHVSAFEKITLYGLPIITKKKINYEKISTIESREIFIRSALVDCGMQCKAHFYRHNIELVEQIKAEEDRQRKRGILISDDAIYALYDEKVPDNICNTKSFNKWIASQEKKDKQYLCFKKQQLIDDKVSADEELLRPHHLKLNNITLDLEYTFDIGAHHDGVTALIPHVLINQVQECAFDWLVPGFLQEKIVALIKALPKKYRRSFVPAPEFAKASAEAMEPYRTSLIDSLGQQLQKMTGVKVPNDVWAQVVIPDYLQMNFKIVDDQGNVLSSGRDLKQLKQQLQESKTVVTTSEMTESNAIKQWEFEEIPSQKTVDVRGFKLQVYPALVDKGDYVCLQNIEQHDEALAAHKLGVCRLYQLQEKSKIKYIEKNLPHIQRICLNFSSVLECKEITRDLLQSIIVDALLSDGDEIRTKSEFEKRSAQANTRLMVVANEFCAILLEVSRLYKEIKQALSGSTPISWLQSIQDIQSQLDHLIYPGFIQQTEKQWLLQLPKYLNGIEKRIKKLEQTPQKDQQRMAQLAPYWNQYAAWRENGLLISAHSNKLNQYHWMLQEMRISLFCQELGTCIKISFPRLDEIVSEIKDSLK